MKPQSELRHAIAQLMVDGEARTSEAISEAVGEYDSIVRTMLKNMVYAKELKTRQHAHLKSKRTGRPVLEYMTSDPDEWPTPDTSGLVASAMSKRIPLETAWSAA